MIVAGKVRMILWIKLRLSMAFFWLLFLGVCYLIHGAVAQSLKPIAWLAFIGGFDAWVCLFLLSPVATYVTLKLFAVQQGRVITNAQHAALLAQQRLDKLRGVEAGGESG